jgi:4-hydroxy-tetrahydrodipicolinate reductase
MATVTTSIRTDAQLKQEADQLFTELGMNFSTAVNIFLRQAVRMQGLPFRPTRDVPNAVTAAAMHEAAKKIPLFFSRNMSLGINLLISLCRRAAQTLGESFDIEIIEKHHNKKLDAPSGMALMIADAITEGQREAHPYVFDRHAERRERARGEIGLHAVRGGTIVGEHEVLFAGKDEVITLSHSAASREVFATGAMRAAHFLVGKGAGLYSMDDVVSEL